ncbi:MAG: RNA polymerase sigma factor [Firmicutes bacterium]|nr:RNA polymerase sigma factor [Bacillota bacterium]
MRTVIGHDVFVSAVEKYSSAVLRIAFHHTQNNADAEEITQEVFLALINAPAPPSEQYLKAWLIRVAINKCRDLLRTAAKRRNVSFEAAANKYSLNQNDEYVMECVNRLKPIERDIVYLFYFEGYSAKEAAGLLGKKEDAIFRRLSRIRIKLKDLLEET